MKNYITVSISICSLLILGTGCTKPQLKEVKELNPAVNNAVSNAEVFSVKATETSHIAVTKLAGDTYAYSYINDTTGKNTIFVSRKLDTTPTFTLESVPGEPDIRLKTVVKDEGTNAEYIDVVDSIEGLPWVNIENDRFINQMSIVHNGKVQTLEFITTGICGKSFDAPNKMFVTGIRIANKKELAFSKPIEYMCSLNDFDGTPSVGAAFSDVSLSFGNMLDIQIDTGRHTLVHIPLDDFADTSKITISDDILLTPPIEDSKSYLEKGKRDESAYPEQARTELQKAIELDPKNAEAYKWKGIVESLHVSLWPNGYQLAIQDYSKAIELAPNAELYTLRGDAYYDSLDYQKSILDYNQAEKLDPKNFYFFKKRAFAQIQLGDGALALADLAKGLKRDFPAVTWKTYTDTVHGFSFQYPSQFGVNDISKKGGRIWVEIIPTKLNANTIEGVYGQIPQDKLQTLHIGTHTYFYYTDGDAGCGGPTYRIPLDTTSHLSLQFIDCEEKNPKIEKYIDDILMYSFMRLKTEYDIYHSAIGASFEYPKDWTCSAVKNDDGSLRYDKCISKKTEQDQKKMLIEEKKGVGRDYPNISDDVHVRIVPIAFTEYMKDPTITKLGQIQFGGKTAIEVIEGGAGAHYSIILSRGNGTLVLQFNIEKKEDADDTIRHIISSFRL